MMIQPLLRSHSEPTSDDRTSSDGRRPNETFALALAESIQAARGAAANRSQLGPADTRPWHRVEPTDAHPNTRFDRMPVRPGRRHPTDHDPAGRNQVSRDRTNHGINGDRHNHDRIKESPDRAGVGRSTRPDDRRSAGIDDAGTDRAGVTRPGGRDSDQAGASSVDAIEDPIRPDTAGPDRGRQVAGTDEGAGGNRLSEVDGSDSVQATVLASVMGVSPADAAAFLDTLMAGLTRSQGTEAAEQLMHQLAALAEQLGTGGMPVGTTEANAELMAAVIEAGVETGLLEPMVSDADADPAALLAALSAALSAGDSGTDGATGGDGSSTAVDGSGTGTPLVLTDHEPTDRSAADTVGPADASGVAQSAAAERRSGDGAHGVTSGGATADGAGIDRTDSALTVGAGIDGTDGASAAGTANTSTDGATTDGTTRDGADGTSNNGSTTDGADSVPADDAPVAVADSATFDSAGSDTPAGRIAPDSAAARVDGTTAGTISSAVPDGIGATGGVRAATGPAVSSPSVAPTPTPAQGLVELTNSRLAEQLRPAFAAVRRGIDGLEELQLRLRNEGGAPIKVDIATVDNEVRVVLSGTNDDVMQRLGQERERLADELRRAGFTSTTVDVRSESAEAGDRRPGTGDSGLAGGYETTEADEIEGPAPLSGADRPATAGLDLDL